MSQHSQRSENAATSKSEGHSCHHCGMSDECGEHYDWCAHHIRPIPEGATQKEIARILIDRWEEFSDLRTGSHNTMHYETCKQELWDALNAFKEVHDVELHDRV